MLRRKAHFIYKNEGNNGDLPCRLRETMRYQRFDVATGVREIDVSDFAPAKVALDSRDGFIAVSPRDRRLFFSGRTASGQLAIVSSADDGATWTRQSVSERLSDNIYAVGGQRVVTGDGQVIGSFTDDDSPAKNTAMQTTSRLSSPAPLASPNHTSSKMAESKSGWRSSSDRTTPAARSSDRTPASAPPSRPTSVRTPSRT